MKSKGRFSSWYECNSNIMWLVVVCDFQNQNFSEMLLNSILSLLLTLRTLLLTWSDWKKWNSWKIDVEKIVGAKNHDWCWLSWCFYESGVLGVDFVDACVVLVSCTYCTNEWRNYFRTSCLRSRNFLSRSRFVRKEAIVDKTPQNIWGIQCWRFDIDIPFVILLVLRFGHCFRVVRCSDLSNYTVKLTNTIFTN